MARRARCAVRTVAAFLLAMSFSAGCGDSGDEGPSLQDIPRYPNATPGESMTQSSPGGLLGGSLSQFTTADSYDEVLGFYKEALSRYDTELMSHTSELGRQTAISIRTESGMLSVAIQELAEEGRVNITFMAVAG